MKILYVITQGNWGGAQRHVYDLALSMKERGIDTIVAHGEGDLLPEKLQTKGIRTIALPSLQRHISLTSDWKTFFALVTLIKKERPTIIHTHSSKAGLMGALAGIITNTKTIFTVHGWAHTQPRPLIHKIVYWCMHFVTVLLTTKTIAVSNYIKNIAPLGFLFGNDIVVIKNGITCTDMPPLPLPPLPSYSHLILTIAELHKTKGLDLLIEAMTLLPESLKDIHLAIAGSGTEELPLHTLIQRLNLVQRVTLLGFIPDASRLMTHADLFVLPSRSESLGYVLLEAGCAGVPALGTDVGGIPEVLDATVSPNTKAIAKGIESLLLNPEALHKNKESLKNKVRTEFTLNTMIDQTTALYKTFL